MTYSLSKRFSLSALCIIMSLVSIPQMSKGESVKLKQKDLTSAIQNAREHGIPVLLHFYTDWCGPCRRMDQMVFSAPELEKDLGGQILLLKVNAEHATDLAQKYQIDSYPTDVFIDANGRMLTKLAGMASYPEFVRSAQEVSRRYQKSVSLVAKRKAVGNDPSPVSFWKIRLGEEGSLNSVEETITPATTSSEKYDTTPKEENKPESIFVALDGFCPVALHEGREWVTGKETYEAIHNQQTYRLSSYTAKSKFEKNPQKYAPRLLGCDPVILWESDRAIPGTTQFAAMYEDELYLFQSEENRALFELDPERYTNTRHVLAPKQIEASIIR